jgi:hypothetical protein
MATLHKTIDDAIKEAYGLMEQNNELIKKHLT